VLGQVCIVFYINGIECFDGADPIVGKHSHGTSVCEKKVLLSQL
jgi:hypothetical protein